MGPVLVLKDRRKHPSHLVISSNFSRNHHLQSRTMDGLPVEACLCATLLMVGLLSLTAVCLHLFYCPCELNFRCVRPQVWCVLVQSEPSCDQTEFLHPNGSCISCPVCGPGEQLSEVTHTQTH